MNLLIEQKLSDKKVNPTAMRMLVLDFLIKQQTAVSLSDIEKGLMPADRITIYRTVKTFEENGLIHSIDDGSGSPKYALCHDDCSTDEHHDLHVHFNCVSCKETFCLPDTKIPDLALPDNFSSIEMNLVVKGICANCAD